VQSRILICVVLSAVVSSGLLAAAAPSGSAYDAAIGGVDSNAAWAPAIQTIDGVQMALVPAGCFSMGGAMSPDEGPIHTVCFERPFWIDVFEVTGPAFATFMNAAGIHDPSGWTYVDGYNTFEEQFARVNGEWASRPLYERSAVFGVTWHEATSYCACRGARLPTEAEWEYAARGPDSLLYPWGDDLVTENVAKIYAEEDVEDAIPAIVGRKPAGVSWVGILDMSGNVYEWTSSLHRSYPYDAADGREVSATVDSSSERVLRGCAWYHPGWIDPVETSARFSMAPHLTTKWVGFRCVRDFEL